MMLKSIENTLFVGNGFSRTVFRDMPAWGDLFADVENFTDNYTILYEAARIKAGKEGKTEDIIKSALVKKIRDEFAEKNQTPSVPGLSRFGYYLLQHNVNNIITTNYDDGMEHILCNLCGYQQIVPENMVTETIYSIRTHKEFFHGESGHRVKLWKIHGDLERVESITLGFDQYCGALSKLTEYVKGTYRTNQRDKKAECRIPMKEKCVHQKFDQLSWAELFFRTNVYIVGFGMAFSEIDIWWLLNKRARYMLEVPEITNTITYLNNPKFENEKTKPDIFAAMSAFGVSWKEIHSEPDYLSSIFSCM